jgi:ABC-type uncharacterized transport system substrate-binding protein
MVVGGATGALAAKNARTTTPVVFAAVTDPLGYGLIESLARPGGNITGVALALGEGFSGKWVELLKEAVPKVGTERRRRRAGGLAYGSLFLRRRTLASSAARFPG